MSLTIVATPIGNLSDLSPRAAEALGRAGLIACEDTRRTGNLLHKLGIKPPKLVSYYKENETTRITELLKAMQQGEQVLLVSDSGMPAISDPGAKLVAAARNARVTVEVIPGPCAAVMAVAGCGLEGPFVFAGFLPRKSGEQAKLLARLGGYPETLVFYESPHRIAATVAMLHESLGNRPAWLARELTKFHEEWLGPDLATLASTLALREEVKGECTLVVAGATEAASPSTRPVTDEEIAARLANGDGTKQVAAWLHATAGTPSREAYQRVNTLAQAQKKR